MEDVGTGGRTVLFVSHNMPAVTRLCSRVITLKDGIVDDDGPAYDAVARYLHEGAGDSAERAWPDTEQAPGRDVARLRRVRIKDDKGQTSSLLDIRQPVGLEMTFEVLQNGWTLMPHFRLKNDQGVSVFTTVDVDPEWRKKARPKGTYTATAWVPGNFLAEGRLFLNAALLTLKPQEFLQFSVPEAVGFQIFDPMEADTARGDWKDNLRGVVRPLLTWETRFSG